MGYDLVNEPFRNKNANGINGNSFFFLFCINFLFCFKIGL